MSGVFFSIWSYVSRLLCSTLMFDSSRFQTAVRIINHKAFEGNIGAGYEEVNWVCWSFPRLLCTLSYQLFCLGFILQYCCQQASARHHCSSFLRHFCLLWHMASCFLTLFSSNICSCCTWHPPRIWTAALRSSCCIRNCSRKVLMP